MTEDEAKTKWCPFAKSRVVTYWKDSVTRVNGLWDEDGNIRCLGSACMAWRRSYWSAQDRALMIKDRMNLSGATHTEATSWVNRLEEEAAEGFCGLAGAPQ